MEAADILGPALVVFVIVMLWCMSCDSFKGHKDNALYDLNFRDVDKSAPGRPTYTARQSQMSTFAGSLDDQGSVGHLNDMETEHVKRSVPNYDEPRDVQIDSRWVPDMAVPMELRSATQDDIQAGNLQFGHGIEYDRTRWADTTESPQSYGVSSDTYGKIVFGDEDEHNNVPDDFHNPLIDDNQMVTYGNYARGSVTV